MTPASSFSVYRARDGAEDAPRLEALRDGPELVLVFDEKRGREDLELEGAPVSFDDFQLHSAWLLNSHAEW